MWTYWDILSHVFGDKIHLYTHLKYHTRGKNLMDLSYINFLDSVIDLYVYILFLIPVIFNLIILLITSRKGESRSIYSRVLFYSQIASLGLIITTFFIPFYSANNVNLGADFPILYNLGFFYLLIFVFPFIVSQGVMLSLYGWTNRNKIGINLLLSGIMILAYYLSMFLWMFFHGVIYLPCSSFGEVLSDGHNYTFTFIIFQIGSYFFFIKHGSKIEDNFYKYAGLFGVILILFIESLKWIPVFFSMIY